MNGTQDNERGKPGVWSNLPIPEAVQHRAAHNYELTPEGCWQSVYFVTRYGYCELRAKPYPDLPEKMYLAHRAAYTYYAGRIPDGMTVHHDCYNRRCVNPWHLRLLTRSENGRRHDGDDFPLGQCRNGHPLTPENTAVWGKKKVKKYCRPCRIETMRQYRERTRKAA